MSKIVLKTARRETSVSRFAVRSAVSGKFVSASSFGTKGKSTRKGSISRAASKKK
jgi:hypothetical protein